ncbi:YaaL family protein [Liquorilactobacillus satsumensis]|uniref:DUF2508 domain-containing protein n=1 Tax=Liquorilactobacillus satsumensis DSM 16230 = JCM 12392 TaxID=1423801 RepID=A0A0R1V3R9_9LACO|nr:YaaL family protein [Liquorilactobacillus satsumensis]KRM00232.1 hypothetical protein FD50_GL002208 [Liquorilactobacillus satsumensis DSM 16230 = JCM 12392]MCC7665792.1 DUF2508 domain-containing protein [Liquorilactobacillus satsumensis]MCP9313363.1 YaaL family protein [Liquorilactobacillus satsumensis]MCP9328194.1 YaaL family protein [Liquorilactobacillus satsumensis]MCP9356413.1 YaaL family protein [Liquorilactobacillus satsumensis]
MFGKKKKRLKVIFDEKLLSAIDIAAAEWEHAKQTQVAVREEDNELSAQTKLAEAKYTFLYMEARRRRVRGHLQSSIIEH